MPMNANSKKGETAMILSRRTTILALGATGVVAACGPGGPGAVAVTATGSAGMNPGPDGSDRPVTVQVLQLRSLAAFNTADPLALQNPAAALGGDLISALPLAVTPGGTATANIALDPSVAAIGVVAGFRNPTGKNVRASAGIGPTDSKTATIGIGPGGLTFKLS